MSEPIEIADQLGEVAAGLYHWRVSNRMIGGGISSSHALCGVDGRAFFDPVRLADDSLRALSEPRAVLLTARCHQRSAWRYRAMFGAQVWLPQDATVADEEPDHRYSVGAALPGDLRALRTAGPEWPHYSFLHEGAPGVLFCSDLVMRAEMSCGGREGGEGKLSFVPPEWHEDPAETRRSVRRLIESSR